ncbi:hypothetical protein L226DRAFT_523774 [Lentinus tigrinus ALCF2SS1-7]|uniref:Uncharacterized protein n=1 Tax=Lentinus tigrinus ALCF2SS1-6 TaxID=1328759 RepID=A0A5C2RYB7_9APHY|nr:hypothetical protein L227DRAFT_566180 [Lentinus tigrinus ALCF2SS1-6]RPD74062.1 hypothetical protein L226DRAFT_523774 [Lentinus tigrinus ALCF2SS1-7]
MGRAAKFFTYAEKQAAKREQAKVYRQSEKGKRTKAEANRRRTQRNHTVDGGPTSNDSEEGQRDAAVVHTMGELSPDSPFHLSTDSFHTLEMFDPFAPSSPAEPEHAELIAALDDIPDDLFDWAHKFAHASLCVSGPGPLLGLWSPSYRFVRPDQDPLGCTSVKLWDNTAAPVRRAVLGAFQCRALLAAAQDRRNRWVHTSLEELEIEVQTEIAARVDGWRSLRDSSDEDSRSEDEHIGLLWGAKIVWMLVEEWEYRQRGVDVYKGFLRSGKMPWQVLIEGIMAFSR